MRYSSAFVTSKLARVAVPVTLRVWTEKTPLKIPAVPEIVEPKTEVEVTLNVFVESRPEKIPDPAEREVIVPKEVSDEPVIPEPSVVESKTDVPPMRKALVELAKFTSPLFTVISPDTTELIVSVPAVRLSITLVEAFTVFKLRVEVADTGPIVVTSNPSLNVCKPVQVGTIAWDRAGVLSERRKVLSVPFAAVRPIETVGLAPVAVETADPPTERVPLALASPPQRRVEVPLPPPLKVCLALHSCAVEVENPSAVATVSQLTPPWAVELAVRTVPSVPTVLASQLDELPTIRLPVEEEREAILPSAEVVELTSLLRFVKLVLVFVRKVPIVSVEFVVKIVAEFTV